MGDLGRTLAYTVRIVLPYWKVIVNESGQIGVLKLHMKHSNTYIVCHKIKQTLSILIISIVTIVFCQLQKQSFTGLCSQVKNKHAVEIKLVMALRIRN